VAEYLAEVTPNVYSSDQMHLIAHHRAFSQNILTIPVKVTSLPKPFLSFMCLRAVLQNSMNEKGECLHLMPI